MTRYRCFSCFEKTKRKMKNVTYEVIINLNNNKNALLHNVHILFDRYNCTLFLGIFISLFIIQKNIKSY